MTTDFFKNFFPRQKTLFEDPVFKQIIETIEDYSGMKQKEIFEKIPEDKIFIKEMLNRIHQEGYLDQFKESIKIIKDVAGEPKFKQRIREDLLLFLDIDARKLKLLIELQGKKELKNKLRAYKLRDPVFHHPCRSIFTHNSS